MAEAAPLYDTYSRAPLRFERGEGVWLITETGERYLDFGAGVAVNVARPQQSACGRGAEGRRPTRSGTRRTSMKFPARKRWQSG